MDQPTSKKSSSWIPEPENKSSWIPEQDDVSECGTPECNAPECTTTECTTTECTTTDCTTTESTAPKQVEREHDTHTPEIEYRPKCSLQLENFDSEDYGFVRDITDPARYAQGLSACEVVGTWSRSKEQNTVAISLISSVDALYDSAIQAWAEFQNITLPEPSTKRAPKKIAKRAPISKVHTNADTSSKSSQTQSSAPKMKRLKSEKESNPDSNDQKKATQSMFNDLRAKLKGNR